MTFLKDIASMVDGILIGDGNMKISNICTIQKSKPGFIAFYYNKKYSSYLTSSKASAIIATKKDFIKKDGIIVQNPHLALITVLKHFKIDTVAQKGVHDSAIIGKNVTIEKNVTIGPFTVLEDNVKIKSGSVIGSNCFIGHGTTIGSNSKIMSSVNVYSLVRIGENCIIHSGSVIGADGYGFYTNKDIHYKIPQNGKVNVGNDVEIGANCTIDRGTIDDTLIGDMCKFDNGVQIGHNVEIGKGCLLTAHVTIAGSSKIGDFCIFGGQSGAIDHVTIGDRAVFACYTVAMKDLPGGKTYSGSPAREIKEKNRRDATFAEVKILKNKIKKFELEYLNR